MLIVNCDGDEDDTGDDWQTVRWLTEGGGRRGREIACCDLSDLLTLTALTCWPRWDNDDDVDVDDCDDHDGNDDDGNDDYDYDGMIFPSHILMTDLFLNQRTLKWLWEEEKSSVLILRAHNQIEGV